MGNAESSSQFSSRNTNDDDDDGIRPRLGARRTEKAANEEEEEEEPTSSDSSKLKFGAAVAGGALLALGAWSLASSSSSGDPGPNGTGARLTGGSKQRPSQNLIKIMSYNVWFREDVQVEERMKAIGRLIVRHSPHVIFFQEVTPNIYQIFESSNWWKWYECSVSPQNAKNRRYFCMLLSKLPVKGFRSKAFDNSRMGRELCTAELNISETKKLIVATSHLESPTPPEMNSYERVNQAKEALNLLKNSPNVVFGGDMNWDERMDGNFPLLGGWVDAWTQLRPGENGWTYDTQSNTMAMSSRTLQKRLDRFICKLRDFMMVSVEMVGMEAIPGLVFFHKRKELPVVPSDHYGLVLTISAV